jgi:hypothetical protein
MHMLLRLDAILPETVSDIQIAGARKRGINESR